MLAKNDCHCFGLDMCTTTSHKAKTLKITFVPLGLQYLARCHVQAQKWPLHCHHTRQRAQDPSLPRNPAAKSETKSPYKFSHKITSQRPAPGAAKIDDKKKQTKKNFLQFFHLVFNGTSWNPFTCPGSVTMAVSRESQSCSVYWMSG